MKKIALSLALLFTIFHWTSAQMAKVKYVKTVHFEIPEGSPFAKDMPTVNENGKILLVNGKESIYMVNKEDESKKQERVDRRKRRFFRNATGKDKIYQNHDSGEQLYQTNFFRKDFLIEEEIPKYKWKVVATEQRDILGYTCMKATWQDTSKMVVAWFTPQIQISMGPEGYSGLPGLILALSVGEDQVILAKDIDTEIGDVQIERPKDGKRMTRAEYDALREEKQAEMKKMWGGSKRRWNRG